MRMEVVVADVAERVSLHWEGAVEHIEIPFFILANVCGGVCIASNVFHRITCCCLRFRVTSSFGHVRTCRNVSDAL
jgi:hypothetical protein